MARGTYEGDDHRPNNTETETGQAETGQRQ